MVVPRLLSGELDLVDTIEGLSSASRGSATKNNTPMNLLNCIKSLEGKAPSEGAIWVRMVWELDGAAAAVCRSRFVDADDALTLLLKGIKIRMPRIGELDGG